MNKFYKWWDEVTFWDLVGYIGQTPCLIGLHYGKEKHLIGCSYEFTCERCDKSCVRDYESPC